MTAAIFLSGIAMATFAASGIFFLKFWTASRDKFFLYFAIACWLISLERIALLVFPAAGSSIRSPLSEAYSWVYGLRLLAFLVILIAIINKNRSSTGKPF